MKTTGRKYIKLRKTLLYKSHLTHAHLRICIAWWGLKQFFLPRGNSR